MATPARGGLARRTRDGNLHVMAALHPAGIAAARVRRTFGRFLERVIMLCCPSGGSYVQTHEVRSWIKPVMMSAMRRMILAQTRRDVMHRGLMASPAAPRSLESVHARRNGDLLCIMARPQT